MSRRLNPSGMSRVVGGKRYTVNSSTLLADNDYFDGQNFDKGGRNTFLYKTRGGAFFRVNMTMWQGERDTIEPLTSEEAKDLYEKLPEHYVDYEKAFDTVVEEASAGRPALHGEPMKQTGVWLPEKQVAWLKAQPEGISAKLRELIDQAMEQESHAEPG